VTQPPEAYFKTCFSLSFEQYRRYLNDNAFELRPHSSSFIMVHLHYMHVIQLALEYHSRHIYSNITWTYSNATYVYNAFHLSINPYDNKCGEETHNPLLSQLNAGLLSLINTCYVLSINVTKYWPLVFWCICSSVVLLPLVPCTFFPHHIYQAHKPWPSFLHTP